MKKAFAKNSKSYTVTVIATPAYIGPTLNFKNLTEAENGNLNRGPTEGQQMKKNNSEAEDIEGTDFETAIKATEYGKFNWLLLFFIAWGFMSCMYATTTMSLILPSAECDLNLSNFDKGLLNSIIYIGMIVSAFFWGLISDAVGRKRVLMLAFALDAFFSVLVGLAQNFTFLVIAKMFSGFISSAPMATMTSYIAENHSNAYRGTITVCSGVFVSLANILLPILAWLIIPRDIRIILFNGYITLPSWRIFLLVSVIPSILAIIVLLFLDESPKFLMFQGNNEEALRVLRKIYKMNTAVSGSTYFVLIGPESFQIKRLRNEMGSDQQELRKGGLSVKHILSTSWKQMVPIFHRSYILLALLPCFIQFCNLFGVNTIRLWSPQLFASAIENEKYGYNTTAPSTICELLQLVPNAGSSDNVLHCNAHPVEDKVYFNSMVTGIVTGICYLISGYIVTFLEKKWLMILADSLSICCCFGLYWSNTSDILLAVISLFIAFTSAASSGLTSAVIEIFPTSLRTTAISLCMTFGRLGALVGNIAFPLLLDLNCTAPFILLAVVILVAGSLALLMPNTKGKHLE